VKALLTEFKRQRAQKRISTGDKNFRAEAMDAINEQSPKGGQRIIYLALFCVIALITWAAVWQVDEVARGEGKVIPSRSVQAVQSLDGGVVAEVLVNEGDKVKKDQPLLRIETIRADALKAEVVARINSLKLKHARLSAEAKAATTFSLPEVLSADEQQASQRELELFAARRVEVQASMKVLDNQIVQRVQEQKDAQSRKLSSTELLKSQDKELAMMKPLVAIGAASDMEVVRLERDVLKSKAERDSAALAIDRITAAMAEITQKRAEIEAQFRSRASVELNETASELSRLTETVPGMTDKVTKTVLRAPIDGIVKTLSTKSLGAVLQPGKDVAEIVPLDDSVLLEARVAPKDIGTLRVGQSATLRLSAYDYAVFGGLKGTLELISPDTVTDEKGNAFYLVRVRSAKPKDQDGNTATNTSMIGSKTNPILPGMTGSVDMLTGTRTVLTYLLKPIFRAQQKAFTER
jgi:membrane fusion protein, adhesin transport system